MLRLLTAAALLSLLSAPSMAQMMRQGGEGMFERADADKDGSVTNPPAPKPLAEAKASVFEDKVYVVT